jgi:hypothetical protein
MKKWVRFPWHIFLLPLFYVLHAYNDYFGILSFSTVGRYTVYYIVLAQIVCLLGYFLYKKNRVKAGIWTICFLIIFFFFGAFYDWLKDDLALPGFFVSYSFLLSFLLVLFVFISWRLGKAKDPIRLHRFFLILTALIFLHQAGTAIFNSYWYRLRVKHPAGDPVDVKLQASDKAAMPDIFFMVFDEYTSSVALKKYFNFDNSALDSALAKNGFYTSYHSQSNYNSTPFSIASALNMQYFQQPWEDRTNDARALLYAAAALKKSTLPHILKEQGYDIINHGFCDFKGEPIHVKPVFEEDEIKAISLGTLWGRIKRDIYWNIIVRMPGYSDVKPADKDHIADNMSNYSGFLEELNKDGDKPRFVMGHLLLPRRPAYVDRYGKPRMTSMADFEDKDHDSLYLEQLIYANTLIDSLAAAANRPRPRPLVLIIEGDHGNRYSTLGLQFRDKQFMNLNTYYFSDKAYSSLYDSISPVNSFRVVMNKYFNTGLPLLKDSTIRLH